MTEDNPVVEALEIAQVMMDKIMDGAEDLLSKKATLAIGAGLLAAGLTRYFLQHPELIEAGIQQVGEALEISNPSLVDVGVTA